LNLLRITEESPLSKTFKKKKKRLTDGMYTCGECKDFSRELVGKLSKQKEDLVKHVTPFWELST